jgi:glycosyltransferase involved in cell wall biosynthesis
MPLFSVIIPSYNRREMLKSALDSVLSQSFRDYEVIVVDDGSDDSTDEMIALYGKAVKYIKQKNSGVSSARNRGIKTAASPYIALLDSDDLWHKDKLMKDAEFLKNNPDIKIHQSEDIWIRSGKRVNPGKKHIKKEGRIFPESLELCMISPSSAVLSVELFEKYGFFDENLQACEDYDLWLRITPFEYTGLIREKLITRFSGHNDQLSFRYSVMDKFRLYSIIELLKKDSLNSEYREIAKAKALEKGEIIRSGALKRNNHLISETIDVIINSLRDETYKQIDSQSLLRI